MSYEGNPDGQHYWLTPPDLMRNLNNEFHFDFDPCPYPRPEGFDGLMVEWGKSNYVNPPFKGPTAWVRKAIREFQQGKTVVLVFPIDKWIHYMIAAGAEIRNLGDIRWHSIEENKPGKGTGRWIAAFVLKRHEKPTIERARNRVRDCQHQPHGCDECWQAALKSVPHADIQRPGQIAASVLDPRLREAGGPPSQSGDGPSHPGDSIGSSITR